MSDRSIFSNGKGVMNLSGRVLLGALCISLFACGKGEGTTPASPTADSGFGDVAFTTYEADHIRVVFTTDSKAKKTWRNMAGPAVMGSYTRAGKEIEILWDPAADHHGSLSEKFRQMGPCSLARYERVDRKGALHDDQPQIFQRTKPVCDTVRLTR